MKKFLVALLCVSMAVSMFAGCGTVSQTSSTAAASSESPSAAADNAPQQAETKDSKDYTIAVVPKLTALAWFERMEKGVKEYSQANSVDAFFTGTSEADGALQAQLIEDLIAQGVDALCVVPFSTEALEPVFKKARDAGIVVITHEAAGMTNIDYDVEAFNNAAYGEHLMEILGKATGGTGEYVQTVGALTSASHMEWVTAAQTLQKSTYPNMKLYGDLIESSDDQSVAYNKIKEVLTANPNIAAIQGSAMPDVAGAALAVEELGLAGKVKIAGTALVSNAGDYVRSGTIDAISFWDPALAGQAMIELAVKVLNGEAIEDGMDLGINGYNKITMSGNVLVGAAWIDVTIDNVDDPAYNF